MANSAAVTVMVDGSADVSSVCPRCGEARLVSFLRIELIDKIRTGCDIDCMCVTCSEVWPISDCERGAVLRGLATWAARPADGADKEGTETP